MLTHNVNARSNKSTESIKTKKRAENKKVHIELKLTLKQSIANVGIRRLP